VRDWATFGLGNLSDLDTTEIRDALAERLSDTDCDTRCEAILGLARRADERAVRAVSKEFELPSVGTLAIQAAALMPRPEFVVALEELSAANHDDQDIFNALEACRSGVPFEDGYLFPCYRRLTADSGHPQSGTPVASTDRD
jgi:HEAT repeat protein